MANSVTHKIDVTSPLLQYNGNWLRGGTDGDLEQIRYDQFTFVYCSIGDTCSISLTFRGTEVHAIGAFRGDSGAIQAQLDDQSVDPPPPPDDPNQLVFQQSLFSRTDLADTAHTLTLSLPSSSAAVNKTVDFDYYNWTSTVNSLVDVRFQDDHPAFVYDPPAGWTTSFVGLARFDGGTGHSTSNTPGASATLTFKGDRAAVYGSIGSGGGPFTAQLDGATVQSFTTLRDVSPGVSGATYVTNQMIYYVDGLSDGAHTLVLTSQPSATTQGLAIDYAIVDGTANNASRAAPSPVPQNNDTVVLSRSHAAGIFSTTGMVSLLLLVSLGYGIALRRRIQLLSAGSQTRCSVLLPFDTRCDEPSSLRPRPNAMASAVFSPSPTSGLNTGSQPPAYEQVHIEAPRLERIRGKGPTAARSEV
ncbi:unnamed protein product [Mycena citricolor]|uniref:Transmembrane protein n=1 Tax=Mycena citricolor TaxID=2018698 RepID=A0AAD2HB05_9AGAR|nr:unnamed protein product [Mycena citricolor]